VGPQICVHPAHSRSLDDLVAADAGIRRAGLGARIVSITDLDLSDAVVATPGSVVTEVGPEFSVDDYRLDLVLATSGVKACAERYPQGGASGGEPEVSAAFAARALRDSGYAAPSPFGGPGTLGAAGTRVDALSAERFRLVATEQADALQTCSLSVGQVS
jgi:hypothetical protein